MITNKSTTSIAQAPTKRLAIARTVIPLSYDKNDPKGYDKWSATVFVQAAADLGNPFLKVSKEIIELASYE